MERGTIIGPVHGGCHVPNARIVSRNNSMLGTLSAVKAGVGIAPLPTTLGDAEDVLIQVLPPVEELTRS